MSRFVLTIDTDNASFDDDPFEVVRLLRKAEQKVQQAGTFKTSGRLMDVNGNSVGEFEWHGGDD